MKHCRLFYLPPLLFLCFSYTAVAQNCQPSDACASAPVLNLNGLICSTAGYSPSSSPTEEDCQPVIAPVIGANGDFWVKFIPLEAEFVINAEVVNSATTANEIQALIYRECNGPVIDCTPECGTMVQVGSTLQWAVGQTYLLRIRSCSANLGVVKVSTSKKFAIGKVATFLPAKLPANGLISGKKQLNCLRQVYNYSMPYNTCAPAYIWRIESGHATFANFDPEQTVDLNPLKPNTSVLLTGNLRNTIQLRVESQATGEIRLSSQLFDGVDSTNRTSLNVVVDTLEHLQNTIRVCGNQKVYDDPTLPGSPFLLNDTCGKTQKYILVYGEAGCKKQLSLDLIKDCDSVILAPLIPIDTVLCTLSSHAIAIGNFSATNQYVLLGTTDSFNGYISGNKIYCDFVFPGSYHLMIKVTNACFSKTFLYTVIAEDRLPKPTIYGPKIVQEKATQSYCVYSPTPNVTWKSTKGLKFKQNYANGQSCITVTFPKITSNGWLIASHGNSCGSEKDSIYVLVKPKTARAEEVPTLAAGNKVETRQSNASSNTILELFPSPAKDLLQIKCNQPFDHVQCTDLLGRSLELKINDFSIYDISFLQSGLCQITIYNEHNKIASKKFVKID